MNIFLFQIDLSAGGQLELFCFHQHLQKKETNRNPVHERLDQ
jgi:hypothetical protein